MHLGNVSPIEKLVGGTLDERFHLGFNNPNPPSYLGKQTISLAAFAGILAMIL